MFLSYTDPNRNISVGDARSELAKSLRNRYKDGEGNYYVMSMMMMM